MNNCPGVRGNAVVVGGGAVLLASTLGGRYLSLFICHLFQPSNFNDVGGKGIFSAFILFAVFFLKISHTNKYKTIVLEANGL